jgi:uncharacterized protein YgbK (DUF1537 family)
MTTPLNRPPRVLGLVADDLTGAGDSAVAFAQHGWDVILHLHPERVSGSLVGDPTSPPTVIAVSTGTRALDDHTAAETTARAIDALRGAGIDRLYLKIDSTVRGSVTGQLTGALRAWTRPDRGIASAVICPAFPQQHRTVYQGRVLVNDIPLEQTPAADDPVTPRTTGELTRILPGARCGTTAQIGIVSPLILDAATDADLDHIAAELSTSGPETVMVGSGGLAAALARLWSLTDPRPAPATVSTTRVLIAVSSLHPVTAAQVAHLRHSPLASLVDVLTTSTTGIMAPTRAAADLADRVEDAVAGQNYGAIVAVGGDGAAAILARLGADHVVIDGAISGGCPTGVVIGGAADGLRLVTKSGGFGDHATLTTITTRLRADSGAENRSVPDPADPRLTQKDLQ